MPGCWPAAATGRGTAPYLLVQELLATRSLSGCATSFNARSTLEPSGSRRTEFHSRKPPLITAGSGDRSSPCC